jgi:hypothetical protein
MLTQRVYLSFVLCTFILFSCSNKKVKNTAGSVTAVISDTVQVQPDEAIDLSEYSNAFANNITQTFTAAQHKISVLTAKKGLRVTVNPAALEKEDGTAVDGKINVSIIELTTSEDLFRSNAATVSNGRLLASGGSYFIGMECNGQKLKIKEGKILNLELPKLKNNEMELFYGNRNNEGSMNWLKAEEPLVFNTAQNFADYNPPYPDTAAWKPYYSKYHLYDSLNSKVIFNGKQITVKEMVGILQKKGIDKNIDSLYIDWRDTYYKGCFLGEHRYRTFSWKKYRIISCADLEAEKDSLAKERKIKNQHDIANKKYDEAWEKTNEENSFTGQLQKYYSPSSVIKLGWINCDRFYDNQQNTEVPLELPITFNAPLIEYFIIYKSFNGMMSGKLGKEKTQQYILSKLPEGESITLIAFTKNNGQLFHCKEEFVIQKNKPLKLNFKNISTEEMNKIFGKNVRI